MGNVLDDLTGLLAIFFGGAIVLTPLVALSLRFAFKPILETFLRMRQDSLARDDRSLQERRINLLEAELQELQRTVQSLAEADSFRRQLLGSRGGGIEPVIPIETPIGNPGKVRRAGE